MKNGTVSVLWYSGDAESGSHVEDVLHDAGCIVSWASSTAEVDDIVRRTPLNVIVADVPNTSDAAFEILAHLRRKTSVPVLLLTDGDSEYVGRCLELGADDCMSWPGSDRELIARVRLRGGRCGSHYSTARLPVLDIDAVDREVTIDGMSVDLTDREFELLSYLAASPNVAFSAEQLLAAVWDSRPEWQSVTTVTEHIYRLRKKLEEDPANPQRIVTVKGRGYMFVG